jgi:hypothetical protein
MIDKNDMLSSVAVVSRGETCNSTSRVYLCVPARRKMLRARSRYVGARIGLDETSPKPVKVNRDENSRRWIEGDPV